MFKVKFLITTLQNLPASAISSASPISLQTGCREKSLRHSHGSLGVEFIPVMIRCTEKHILHQKQGEKNVKFSNQGAFSFSSLSLVLYSFMRCSIRDGHRENRKEAQEKRESIILREPRETVTLVHDRTICGELPGSGLSQAGGNQRG